MPSCCSSGGNNHEGAPTPCTNPACTRVPCTCRDYRVPLCALSLSHPYPACHVCPDCTRPGPCSSLASLLLLLLGQSGRNWGSPQPLFPGAAQGQHLTHSQCLAGPSPRCSQMCGGSCGITRGGLAATQNGRWVTFSHWKRIWG